MSLKVYNTLTRKKEEFVPREPGKVSIYVCGVTPYDFAHIGNGRPPVFWDTVQRFFLFLGYQVTFVQNFTDVDDKIILRSRQLGKDPLELAEEYAQIYLEDLKTLGILPADHYPKVSEHIPEIIEMVQTLETRGYAYRAGGDVYYDVSAFADYGKLSGRDLTELLAGARVEVNEVKQDAMDFALWKAAKPGEIAWESPWGSGRPGWHIECSAMAVKYLGAGFDLHGGGEDLVFPHHENEIAQSEAYLGAPFARYWLHNAFITVKGEKMAKSLGNFSTIRQVITRYSPAAVRFWFIGTHYRNPISFGEEELQAAAKGLERLENARFIWEDLLRRESVAEVSDALDPFAGISEMLLKTRENFIAAMEDDFNTPQALATLYDLVREVNRWSQKDDFRRTPASLAVLREALELLTALGQTLGLFLNVGKQAGQTADDPEHARIEEMIMERTRAKKEKNWAIADQIRDALKNMGVVLEDTPQGVRWRRE